MNESLRFWVVIAALLSVFLLTDVSAPRWLYAVPVGIVGAYLAYVAYRFVKRGQA